MLNRHFLEFIELLEKHGVRYLVVGGYAVGIHGFPRYTGNLDVFVAISQDNARKILRVFTEFGFNDLGLKEGDLMEEEIVVEIGREPLKVQVLTGIDGVSFDEYFTITDDSPFPGACPYPDVPECSRNSFSRRSASSLA